MNKHKAWRLLLPVISVGILSVVPASAQDSSSATAVTASARNFASYDLTKEITVQGTISKIDTSKAGGPIGTHILLQTAQGTVDVHLGYGQVAKPDYLGISEGQGVRVVGMMESIGDASVLLARILTTPNRIFILRNEHGIPFRAVPRRSSSVPTTLKGGL